MLVWRLATPDSTVVAIAVAIISVITLPVAALGPCQPVDFSSTIFAPLTVITTSLAGVSHSRVYRELRDEVQQRNYVRHQ